MLVFISMYYSHDISPAKWNVTNSLLKIQYSPKKFDFIFQKVLIGIFQGNLYYQDVKEKKSFSWSLSPVSQTDFSYRRNFTVPHALLDLPDLKHILPWLIRASLSTSHHRSALITCIAFQRLPRYEWVGLSRNPGKQNWKHTPLLVEIRAPEWFRNTCQWFRNPQTSF